jgi:hypothetical protein
MAKYTPIRQQRPAHYYAAEPIVCVAEYAAERSDTGLLNAAVTLIAGALTWAVYCIY